MFYDGRKDRVGRREFLHWSARTATGLFLAPFLQACQRLGLIESTGTPASLPTATSGPSSTATPVLSVPPQISPTVAAGVARVAFVRTRDRASGIQRALSLLGGNPVGGRGVLLKPNFNSDDPAPASTHADTLQALIGWLQQMGASHITVADRSGMGDTRPDSS